MITYTFNTVTKFLLILAPLIIVSGCATIADPTNPASQAAANIQAEPAPERLVRYCRRMAETNNLRIAIGICERALAAAPENPEPVIILAEAYLEAEHRAEAAEAYRFALSIDDQSGEAHFGLGKLYLRDSRLEEAKLHLEAALHSGEQAPAIFNALGVLEDQFGNHDSAQAFYEAGLELDPDNTALANNYGVSVLLSKPSENGDNIFGQLPPEQSLTNTKSHADFSKKSIRLAEKRILPLKLPTQPAVSSFKKAEVQTTASVPALMQTPEETLFSFFVDSQTSDPSTMDPAITPAPVEIVDVQALEPLSVPVVARVPEKAVTGPILARALLDYNPVQTSTQVKANILASSVPEKVAPISSTDVPSIDLATVHPGRNPFFQPETQMASDLNNRGVSNDAAPPSPVTKLQIAEIPHLPIEGPKLDDIPKTDTQNAAVPTDLAPAATFDGTPVQTDFLIFDSHDPVQAAIMTNAPIPADIVTDANFSPATTGLSLLQYNEETGSTFDSYNPGQIHIATHHDGIIAPGESGVQGDAEPGSNAPEDEPLFWPSSLADLQLPLKRLPLPHQSGEPMLAMMLLNRSVLSTV